MRSPLRLVLRLTLRVLLILLRLGGLLLRWLGLLLAAVPSPIPLRC